jgi:hypothetical protein
MINWISSEDENYTRMVDYNNLLKIINFIKNQNSEDEMIRYVCQIFDEYKNLLIKKPMLIRDSLKNNFGNEFIIDGDLRLSNVIISPSDLNAYFTIKSLNEYKKNLVTICFDMHSDTYDFNDSLWKGNSFSKLMHEGYINHYIVIGVPREKRKNCLNDTNEELRHRTHLIDESELFDILNSIDFDNIFISIDVDCFDCRKSQYTSLEYSPSTILNYISHIDNVDFSNYVQKIHDCVLVKNSLGYSNYFHTGENDLTYNKVIEIVNKIKIYCKESGKQLGLTSHGPYYEIMEVNGYDYNNLTTELVINLINGLSLKEVNSYEKGRILKED